MKKTVSILLMLALVLSISTISVFAEPAIIGSMNGSVGAIGDEWGDYADGDSITIGKTGDVIGYKFENVAAGVYKIAMYITIEELGDGRQLRFSPRVGGLRCWIDWATSQYDRDETPISEIYEETEKVILVSVINVPEDGMTVEAGWWQDENAIVGTCDKIVLATGDYNFANDPEYTLVNEKDYRGNDEVKNTVTNFTEDPEQKLLPAEDSWVPSVATEPDPTIEPTVEPTPEATAEPTPEATAEPTPEATVAPTVEATVESTVEATVAPTETPDEDADNNGDSTMIIIIVVAVVVIAAAVVVFIVMKKKAK